MKGILLLLICLLEIRISIAQSAITFTGYLLDDREKGIGFATILLSGTERQFGAITDSCGYFHLEIVPGTYQIRMQCVGFEPLTERREILASVCDTFRLQASVQKLGELRVSANRIQRKADSYVVQVPKALNQDGMELLQQAPGVWISDGKISINGSSGTKVYVNEREIRLEGELLASYLQSLRSDDIRSIEVEPFAGADQDAQSKGGAIYIRLRQSEDKGWQGNATLNSYAARGFFRYQPHLSWNGHQGKWDTYGSIIWNQAPRSDGSLKENRTYAIPDKRFHNDAQFDTPNRYAASRLGLLFHPDSVHSFGGEWEYLHHQAERTLKGYSGLHTPNYTLYNKGNYLQQEKYRMMTGSFNYRYKQKHSTFKVLADYVSKKSEGNNRYNIRQNSMNSTSDTLYRMKSQVDYRIASVETNWSYSHNPKTSWSLGAEYTFTGMEDAAYSEGWWQETMWRPIPAYDYALDYQEHIAALYASFGKEWKGWSLKAGLRAEYTHTANRTEHLTRNDLSLFPHLDLSWAMDNLHQKLWVAQYARYIERPPFAELNPNRIQTSDYSYTIGNPALRPTYIHRFSLTFVWNYRYTLTIGGNLHRDLIRAFTLQDASDPDISYVTYANHHRENHWFVAFNIPWQPVYWFGLNTNIIGVKQDIQFAESEKFTPHYLYFGNATATFYLPENFQIEAQYNGASRLYSGNSEVNPTHRFNLHLRKKWHEGKWAVRLSLNNIFNQQTGYVSRVSDYTTHLQTDASSRGRTLQASITWNFSVGKSIRTSSVEKNSAKERARLNNKM